MRKMLSGLIGLLLILALAPTALAQESEASALSLEELMAWTAGYVARAEDQEPVNAPVGEESLTEDGYAYIYDFATLYFDKPTLEGAVLNALVITEEGESGIRNVAVNAYLSDLLGAYYNENPDLMGSEDFAALYAVDTFPSGAVWAWLQRSGQQAATVQYAIHEQTASGADGYTDCGLIYTLQENTVVAIRAYGLNSLITLEQAQRNLAAVEQVQQETSYHMYPTSFIGTDLKPFERDDLIFSQLDFLSLTPEEAVAALGECLTDEWMDDDGAYLRTLTFPSAVLTYAYDGDKNLLRLDMMTIDSDGLEGPRGARIGESLSSVLMRFRHGEGEFDGVSRELLYGDGETPPYGTAEYGDNANATLRYALSLENGRQIVLHMDFTMNALSEIMIYYW